MDTLVELKSLLSTSEFDFRFTCGYTKSPHQIQLSDREDFVHSIWLHYVLFNSYAELDQLRKGLFETLTIELVALSHGNAFRTLLVYSTLFDLTADYLDEVFVILYSDNGSNKQTLEEATGQST